MTASRSRLLLVASLAALLVVLGVWAAWPEPTPRADLQAVDPVTTTTTTTSTTAPPTTAPTSTTTTSAPAPAGPTSPTRLQIGAIGVDAPVVPVGLAPDGQMEIPAATEVGWYRLGPQPGAGGSAVLAAHVDYDGKQGAFFDLARIPVGAEVVVDGAEGPRRFVVTEREQVAKAEIRLEDYFTDQGPARLTLITCGGAFDRGVGHYQDNLVITATPVT